MDLSVFVVLIRDFDFNVGTDALLVDVSVIRSQYLAMVMFTPLRRLTY